MVHVTLPRSWRIAAVGSTVAVLCLGPLPMAAADGPGYGGDAGALAVSWVASTDAAPPGTTTVPTTGTTTVPSTGTTTVPSTGTTAVPSTGTTTTSSDAPAIVPSESPASTPASAPSEAPAQTTQTPTQTPTQTDAPATADRPAASSNDAPTSAPSDAPVQAKQTDSPASAPTDAPVQTTQTDSPASAPTDAPTSAPSEPAVTSDAPVPAAMSFGGGARGVAAAFALPAVDPALTPDALSLMVRGLGFRSKSKIQVRIGSDLPVETRADSAGALAVALDPRKLGGAQPGVSVMAVGRNQSGTEVTLFGSVPPVADGSGPMSLVPWGVACVALVGLAAWMRRRHTSHESSVGSDTVA